MANSQETNVNLKINRVPDKATLEDMVANNQLQPNQIYMIPSEHGQGLVTMQTKVLWTNPNPTSSFAGQEVTVNGLSDYQYILIKLYNDISTMSRLFLQLFEVNKDSRLFYVGNNGSQVGQRDFSFSTNKITFSDGKWNGNTSNVDIIPYQIIGIKLIESPTQITNKYSTEETVVGEWIDGKPIYRKTYIINNLVLSNSYNIYDPIDTLVRMYGTLSSNTDYQHQLGAYYNSSFYSGIQYNSSSNSLSIFGNGYSGETATVYIEYTKTTD